MREDIANLVHPVLSYGLLLKERLAQGDIPSLDVEQAALKGLLLSESEARRWTTFGGDTRAESVPGEPGRRAEQFLGIRYALVCWLDEIFTLDSPWEAEWNERKLEVALYGTNDRAWKFWDQARQAEARPQVDALEVFFLCVVLGFCGELRDSPERLATWVSTSQNRVVKARGQEWSYPAEVEPPTHVPPLHGRERLQRVLLAGGLALLILIPILAFMVVQNIGG
jgi:type VI secretion system protein ImpK